MSAIFFAFLLAADPEPTSTSRADAFVAALIKGDADAAMKHFDDTMRQKVTADSLKNLWAKLGEQVGDFDKVLGSRSEPRPPYEFVFVTCQFAKAKIDVRVVVNEKKQIAGLQVIPTQPPYSAPDYVKPDSFSDSEIVVGKGTPWPLPGTLSLPKSATPVPGVVLVHGSGPNDRDETVGGNKPFRDLAGGLASRGVAVVRYDKRTRVHGPKLKVDEITIDTETVDDVRAALALLRQTPGVDATKLYVLGHSLGAMMAPKIASLEPTLAGIVIAAGPTRKLEDIIVEQFEYLGGEPDRMAKLRQQAAKVKDPALTPQTPKEELPLGQPGGYWLSLRGYDSAATTAKLTCRVLVLHADRDYQVTLADYAGWEKALAGKPNVTLKRFAGLNHLFAAGSGKSMPQEYEKRTPVTAEVIEAIAGWVKP